MTTYHHRGPSLLQMATTAADLEARKRERAMTRRPLNIGKVREAERNLRDYRRLAYDHF